MCTGQSSYLQHLMERNFEIIHLRFPFHWEYIFALALLHCVLILHPLLEISAGRNFSWKVTKQSIVMLLLFPNAAEQCPGANTAHQCCSNLLGWFSALFLLTVNTWMIFYSVLKIAKHILQKLQKRLFRAVCTASVINKENLKKYSREK